MSTQDLNDIYFAISSLREARALVADQVCGTNDRKYDLCKEWDIVIKNAERAYNEIRKSL